MSPDRVPQETPELSVVIPSYNSALWLPSTLSALDEALRRAGATAEVVIIDDGSTDDTRGMVDSIRASFACDLLLVSQSNRGRFLARWEGIQRTRADLVMLIDSRVLIHRDSVAHVLAAARSEPSLSAWNGYVPTDPGAPLVGLFWEVPTHVFWGRFLRNPVPYDLTAETFDSAPKGTTMFLARRAVLVDAFRFAWPVGDARLVSDDTKMLRHLAEKYTIRLDPAFSATYRPRTTVKGFLRHTLDRGTLFVDSYAGTSALRSAVLIGLALAPLLALLILILLIAGGQGSWALTIAIVGVVLALMPTIPATVNRCPPRAVLAYIICLPLFVVPFWLGVVRGVFIHRRAFVATRRKEHE